MDTIPHLAQAVTYQGRSAIVSDMMPEYYPKVSIRFSDDGSLLTVDYAELEPVETSENQYPSLPAKPGRRGQSTRLSRLQRAILAWLDAEHRRVRGSVVSFFYTDLVKAMSRHDASNVAKSVRNLERKGLLKRATTPKGQTVTIALTSAANLVIKN